MPIAPEREIEWNALKAGVVPDDLVGNVVVRLIMSKPEDLRLLFFSGFEKVINVAEKKIEEKKMFAADAIVEAAQAEDAALAERVKRLEHNVQLEAEWQQFRATFATFLCYAGVRYWSVASDDLLSMGSILMALSSHSADIKKRSQETLSDITQSAISFRPPEITGPRLN